ncbi:guanine nucleotide exchange factor MON1 NDAI_0I01610 [Naumovozyma dairenensis CBS 421]|uniref:Vacuolar fusion protein MON1 n=1 Tax=Naumovozyma dairenensis (strain ATCC 10597 / BCRC 20456 / CBS 421 / NBRC 0211 / NRRL Y-12639) TaxID=1071378 RepID=G0WG19_NAUDC|nr:hypothetical protein NDAI_0I01610 [Naumovozyma dairenensis CBS 421]CCD26730.1 hypothetical protein NDAI_0I01610 [Naumovozyma dairenensis CBS 421]
MDLNETYLDGAHESGSRSASNIDEDKSRKLSINNRTTASVPTTSLSLNQTIFQTSISPSNSTIFNPIATRQYEGPNITMDSTNVSYIGSMKSFSNLRHSSTQRPDSQFLDEPTREDGIEDDVLGGLNNEAFDEESLRDKLSESIYSYDGTPTIRTRLRSLVSNEIPSIFKENDLESMQLGRNSDLKSYDKNFFIFTSAGKPIYSMDGDDQQLTSCMGIIHTIMNYFQLATFSDIKSISSMVSGQRVTFLDRSPIILVGYSTRGETHHELIKQLDVLHSYILSSLSERQLSRLFAKRDNFDLRNFLEVTDFENLDEICHLLSDRLYPDLPFNALQCLPMSYSTRTKIHETMLAELSINKTKTDGKELLPRGTLLYGLIISPNNKLCSIMRPKGHTLHTTDLQLLFSLIWNQFQNVNETQEMWAPVCFPKFNPNGFLYCYIKFLKSEPIDKKITSRCRKPALVLISAQKDAFFPLKQFSNNLIDVLRRKGDKSLLREICTPGGFTISEVGAPLIHHFIYKSKKHVQYTMPELNINFEIPDLETELLKYEKKMKNYYQELHNSIFDNDGNSFNASILNFVNWYDTSLEDAEFDGFLKKEPVKVMGLAWLTPKFELYLVCNNGVSDKEKILKSAKKIVSWCKRHQSRLFIQDGAVF